MRSVASMACAYRVLFEFSVPKSSRRYASNRAKLALGSVLTGSTGSLAAVSESRVTDPGQGWKPPLVGGLRASTERYFCRSG